MTLSFFKKVSNFKSLKGSNFLLYVLLSMTVIFTLPSILPSASAEITVDWTVGGLDSFVDTVSLIEGNLASGTPISVQVTDNDSDFDPNVVDTIDVLITSPLEPLGVTLTLTETEINSNVFHGDTLDYVGNFVFIQAPYYRFSITDTVTVVIYEESTADVCTDGMISQLDSVDDFTGMFVYSDTEVEIEIDYGVGLILNETDVDSCIFEGTLNFTDVGPSDWDTGTLFVSEGDLLTFYDDLTGNVFNGQIIPTVDGKGSITAQVDDVITATYMEVSSDLLIDSDNGWGGGTGGGGAVRTGLVVDNSGGSESSSDSGNGSGCNGDCNPPTLGVDSTLKRIVYDGFSYNDHPIDVDLYYTPYPLVTVQVGEQNRAILKIYDDGGTQNIAHVELGFGLGKGESFSENRAAIILDISFDGSQHVTTFDPEHVLDGVSVVTSKDRCGTFVSSQCLVVTIDHTFREPLEFNMVGTQVWDHKKNSWQNFYNHGVHIIGDSVNPPKTKDVAFGTKDMRGLFTLTQINKIEDKWIDEFGNIYQHNGNDKFDLINAIPRQVIEDYTTMHGCDRTCSWFETYKQYQENIAQSKIDTILGGKIAKDLSSFTPGPEFSIVSRADDPVLQRAISLELLKAEEIFAEKWNVKQNFDTSN